VLIHTAQYLGLAFSPKMGIVRNECPVDATEIGPVSALFYLLIKHSLKQIHQYDDVIKSGKTGLRNRTGLPTADFRIRNVFDDHS